MYARIIAGQVVEVMSTVPQISPGECAQIIECGSDTGVGWKVQGEEVIAPSPDDILTQELVDIEAEYQDHVFALKDRIPVVLLKDGATESSIRVSLTAEWQQLCDARDAKILSLFGG